jgi:hypothetical protein
MSGLKPWSPPAAPVAVDADPIFVAIEMAQSAKTEAEARYALVRKWYKIAKERGLGNDSPLTDRNAFVEARIGASTRQIHGRDG